MSQRYFLTAESTYEDLRQSLNVLLQYPNALGKSVFQTALYAPRDNFRRVLLAVDAAIPGYATVSAAIQPLLDSDAMEEVDEATYLAAVASATGGGATFTTVTDTLTYGNFLPSGGTLDLALSGIDSALGGKAAITDIRYKGEWSAGGYGQGDIVYKSVAAGSEVSGYIGTLWVCTDIATSDEPDGTTSAWTRFKAVAESHAHSATDVTSGTFDIARIPTGTSSTTVSLGNHTHSQLHDRSHAITSTSDHTAGNWRLFHSNGSGQVVELAFGNSGQALISNGASAAPSWGSAGSNSASDLTTGTLANARMTTRARASINLYLWSAFR